MTDAQRVVRITDDLRSFLWWLPPHVCAVYAAQFVEKGAE